MKNKRTTTVTTRINVRKALEQAESGVLTSTEEKVLRARHGASLAPEDNLELKGQQFAETRAKLAMIEQMALEAMSRQQRPAQPERTVRPVPTSAEETKAHIIRRLRGE